MLHMRSHFATVYSVVGMSNQYVSSYLHAVFHEIDIFQDFSMCFRWIMHEEG